ncbi:MAG: SIMPL domain-containing protein [Saprospiraceae bacterium]
MLFAEKYDMNIRILLFLFIFYQIAQAQNTESRFIEVVGYAETEIIPDEIYYTIELKEFTENRNKISLDTLDARFLNMTKQYQIPLENIEISDTYSRKYYMRRKDQEVFRTKNYTIKFADIEQLDQFGQAIEAIPIEQASITKLNYTEIIALETQLKIRALENAQTKAQQLLAAIGETIGEVITISEFYENDVRSYLENYMSFINYNQSVHYASLNPDNNKNIPFKKSKLSVTVKAKFKIGK